MVPHETKSLGTVNMTRTTRYVLSILCAVVLWGGSPGIRAQSSVRPEQAGTRTVTGYWQGVLEDGSGLRAVLQIRGHANGKYSGVFYSIDEGSRGIGVALHVDHSHIHFSVPALGGSYAGVFQLSASIIRGRWWSAGQSVALNFEQPPPANRWRVASYKTALISVAPGVKLEVLDWGGSGRPLVLLAGLGDTAHVFDEFATKLTANYHVYGITRRGYGASSRPSPMNVANYGADRLGRDVLAVLAALKLRNCILVGHSIAGEELSSVASQPNDRVGGLVYLEAGYGYSFYSPELGDYQIDLNQMRTELDKLTPDLTNEEEHIILKKVQRDFTGFERDLNREDVRTSMLADSPPSSTPAKVVPTAPSPGSAILLGLRKFTMLSGHILAIFAIPHRLQQSDFKNAAALAEFKAYDEHQTSAIADNFERGVSGAKVVRIRNADHYIFRSNETDVLREIETFVSSLPKPR